MLSFYNAFMRTTITLDQDVAEALDREIRKRPRATFKEVVNSLLRAGLHFQEQSSAAAPFVVQPRALGARRELNYDNIGALLEEIEGAAHK